MEKKFITRGKNQALFNFLPKMWVPLKDSKNNPCSAIVRGWYSRKIENVYNKFVEDEIRVRLKFFEGRGGDVSQYDFSKEKMFEIVEANNSNQEMPCIVCDISPLLFYCDSCGKIKQYKAEDKVILGRKCSCSDGTMKQLQFVYSCECGFAEPISVPLNENSVSYSYHPVNKTYRIKIKKNQIEKDLELTKKCPNCGSVLTLDNTSSRRNYIPQSVTVINLFDDKAGKFFEKGLLAFKLVVARWIGKVLKEEYLNVLDDPEYAFREPQKEDLHSSMELIKAKEFMKNLGIPETPESLKKALDFLHTGYGNRAVKEIDEYAIRCDEFFEEKKNSNEEKYMEFLRQLSYKLMQYYTILDSDKKITQEECIDNLCKIDMIDNAEEIYDLQKKLGIENMMVARDVEIVNCVYGYTRKTEDPRLAKGRLKMNAYTSNDGRMLTAYGSKLTTEGILFNISQAEIINWLYKNGIIKEFQLFDLEDQNCVKKWFSENIDSKNISSFGNNNPADKATDAVFSLLHSMAHAFLKSAGEICGLGANSLSEYIFLDTASIFIYSQSEQGTALGALSGMTLARYDKFLKETFESSRNCIWDPICVEDSTSCSACLILPETTCKHFNANLGRKYLYSFDEIEDIKYGFWDIQRI